MLLITFLFILINKSYCRLEIPALGRTVHLCTLYDVRTAQFTGSAFINKLTRAMIESIPSPYFKAEMKNITTFSEKCSMLNLSNEIGISVLSGLLETTGSAGYLNEEVVSEERLELGYSILALTTKEELRYTYDSVKELYSPDMLLRTDATRLVTGISWGAQLIISFTQEKKNSDLIKEITGSLGVSSGAFANTIDMKSEIKKTASQRNSSHSLNLKIHADLPYPDKGIPHNMFEVRQYVANISAVLRTINGGKGKPMTYYLTSLADLGTSLQLKKDEPCDVASSSIIIAGSMTMFNEIAQHEALLRVYESKFSSPYVPKAYKQALQINKGRFTAQVILYKIVVKKFVMESRSSCVSTSSSQTGQELVSIEETLRLTISELKFPYLEEKQHLYERIVNKGIIYLGSEGTLETIFIDKKEFAAFFLPPQFKKKCSAFFRGLFKFFDLSATSNRVVVDCEFNHPICSNARVNFENATHFIQGYIRGFTEPYIFEY